MAVVYDDTTKTNRMQLVSDRVAGKTFTAYSGGATQGKLVIGTSSLSGATGVLATILLITAPFTVSGSGTVVATLQGVPLSVAATASGTAAKAELRTSADVVIVSGLSVGTSGSDINLTSTAITSGQTVTVTSGTITHG